MSQRKVAYMECEVLQPRTFTQGQRNIVECTILDPNSMEPIKKYRRSVVVGRKPYIGWEAAMKAMAKQARKNYILLGGTESVPVW